MCEECVLALILTCVGSGVKMGVCVAGCAWPAAAHQT